MRYGEHVCAIFVALVFSSGMPLLTLSCAASFAAHYWVEKWELLRVSIVFDNPFPRRLLMFMSI